MDFIKNQKLLQARENRRHVFLGDQNLTLPTWQEIIECVNWNMENDKSFRGYEYFGLAVWDCSTIKCVDEARMAYATLDTNLKPSAHLYVSLCTKAKTSGWHWDDSDIVYWQAIGETKFEIEDDGREFTYIMKPNQMVFVPRGMYHNTTPLTPRAGISLGLDYKKQ